MEAKEQYVVQRENVYGGQVLMQCNPKFKFFCNTSWLCRGMLFTVDENGLAQDLIYDSPRYPIVSDVSEFKTKNKFIVHQAVNLEKLLEYLKYNDQLTRYELNKIFEMLICSSDWLNRHHELFGLKKCTTGYCTGGEQTVPFEIYDNLSRISILKNCGPSVDEQAQQSIKRLV